LANTQCALKKIYLRKNHHKCEQDSDLRVTAADFISSLSAVIARVATVKVNSERKMGLIIKYS